MCLIARVIASSARELTLVFQSYRGRRRDIMSWISSFSDSPKWVHYIYNWNYRFETFVCNYPSRTMQGSQTDTVLFSIVKCTVSCRFQRPRTDSFQRRNKFWSQYLSLGSCFWIFFHVLFGNALALFTLSRLVGGAREKIPILQTPPRAEFMQRTCNYLERHTWLCGRRGRIFIKGPGQERIIKSFTKGEALQNRAEGGNVARLGHPEFPCYLLLEIAPSICLALDPRESSFLPSFLPWISLFGETLVGSGLIRAFSETLITVVWGRDKVEGKFASRLRIGHSLGQDTLILSTREFITHAIKAVVFICTIFFDASRDCRLRFSVDFKASFGFFARSSRFLWCFLNWSLLIYLHTHVHTSLINDSRA